MQQQRINQLCMSSVSINYLILYTAGPETVLQLPSIFVFTALQLTHDSSASQR